MFRRRPRSRNSLTKTISLRKVAKEHTHKDKNKRGPEAL
uniref:Uncharacterized protein n=1 Tax=Rhizophora mucronata TaxID=61149 RepID=A0A2P2NQA2_RHIMU